MACLESRSGPMCSRSGYKSWSSRCPIRSSSWRWRRRLLHIHTRNGRGTVLLGAGYNEIQSVVVDQGFFYYRGGSSIREKTLWEKFVNWCRHKRLSWLTRLCCVLFARFWLLWWWSELDISINFVLSVGFNFSILGALSLWRINYARDSWVCYRVILVRLTVKFVTSSSD